MFKPAKLVPLFICGGAIGLVCLFQALTHYWHGFQLFQRVEWMTYDWRVREAVRHSPTNASNLGFVFISDDSISALIGGTLDYKAGLYWPRHVYGRLVQELATQGAEGVGFDILFAEQRPDHAPVLGTDGGLEESDAFFARQTKAAGNIILAADKGILPVDYFRTNAWAVGDIAAGRDSDGILRRTKAFEDYYIWNPLIKQMARMLAIDLRRARFRSGEVVFTDSDKKQRILPIDAQGNFNQIRLYEELTGQPVSSKAQPMQKAFTRLRVWDMGLVLAARGLRLDLNQAQVERHRIVLRGENGVERIIPIDPEGRFYIDWSLTPYDARLTKEPIESLLLQERSRRNGETNTLTNRWKNKLVIVGSTASGNDLTDLGATPLEKETYLTSRFWNTANSLITGRFIQQPNFAIELILILSLGLLAGPLTWHLRPLLAVSCVLVAGTLYVGLSVLLYVQYRYWLPLVLPLGGLFLSYFALVIYQDFFEQNERRRIRKIFAKIVSPNVVHELLKVEKAEKLSLIGARRKVTVFFADVRGFTELTDQSQVKAEEHVRAQKLGAAEAEAYFDAQSQEVLQTVNLYLGSIADTIKKHEGTLDKYIGDCVMAFWGAPTPQEKHAVCCVRAAIDAQRATYALNQQRALENKRIEQENLERAAQSQLPLPLFKLLSLGTGINTGTVTVGLMGSDAHIVNYTVFGREVNLASRLEGFSGRGRILIGEATYHDLLRDDPELAATCAELSPAMLKGFTVPVKMFEVPWKPSKPAETSEASPKAGAVT